MEYDKKLILKAINKRCDICKDFITETEANNCEFHYSRTSGKEIFSYISSVGLNHWKSNDAK